MTPGEPTLTSVNHILVTMLILLGFPSYITLWKLLFGAYLLTSTLPGNGDTHLLQLYSPMYFFLSVLYFLDICNSSVVTSKFW